MAQKDSRRLSIVMYHLYPNLKRGKDGDYYLQNNSDGNGTYVVWKNNEIAEPTDKELSDVKEAAMNENWWKILRLKRNTFLKDSDQYAVSDRPNSSDWITYRQELRDLPTTVSKPDFETLNNQSINETIDNIVNIMPTKPGA